MNPKLIVLIIAFCISAYSKAFADMTVTSRSSFRMMGMVMSDMTTVQMYRGERSRAFIEWMASTAIPAMPDQAPEHGITIIDLDQGSSWILSPQDSSFTETIFARLIDTIPASVTDQQSLDSALYEKPKPDIWTLESFTQKDSVFLGMPCAVITSSATAAPSGTEKERTAACEFWIVSDANYYDEIVAYDKKLNRLVGQSANMQLEAYSAVLDNFSVTFADMGIDSLIGSPVKVDLYVGYVLTDEKVEEMKIKLHNDSLPDSSADFRDSLITILGRTLRETVQSGLMELLHLDYEINNIDTTTLPDSLFEIPAGFTKR